MGRRSQLSASAIPLRRRYDSAISVDRYSEHSIHAGYMGKYKSSELQNKML